MMKIKLPILLFAAAFLLFFNISCIPTSYLHSLAKHQASILRNQIPVDEVLKSSDYSIRTKEHLLLSQKVLAFAPSVGLDPNGSYQKYVPLDEEYVTYVVSAAEKFKLQAYEWSYPIVGILPYKGFPTKGEALIEAEKMTEKGYDTFVRGVRAYSSLGWFDDPIFSSMIPMDKISFAETLFHEILHLNYFAKGHADFNEQLASVVGLEAAKLFFTAKNEKKSIEILENRWQDAILFSKFISVEIEALRKWYSDRSDVDFLKKQDRLQTIQKRFNKEIKPKLLSDSYENFSDMDLNNASLLLFGTYMKNVARLRKDYKESGLDLKGWIEKVKKQEAKYLKKYSKDKS